MNQYYVYILSNANHTVFYTGITNDLIRRIYEHRNNATDGFSKRYGITKLMYYESCPDPDAAITREKQIKKYSQKKKLSLILRQNPGMNDLYDQLITN